LTRCSWRKFFFADIFGDYRCRLRVFKLFSDAKIPFLKAAATFGLKFLVTNNDRRPRRGTIRDSASPADIQPAPDRTGLLPFGLRLLHR
jgi:hypothetical protein